MPDVTDDLDTTVSRARTALDGAGEAIGGDPSPRYELFHAATSICSQKVRCVLAHHDLPYASHTMNLFLGQTYLPDYVRLRMLGCDRLGGALVAHHSGSTATDRGGCDGAVVPTLVDWETREVLVDSKRICLHVDAGVPEDRRLRPAALAAAIDAQIAIVDDLPNYQMLMGRTPGDRERPESRSDTLAAFSMRKVGWCDGYLAEQAGDPTLIRAYLAKRAKELSAADELFSPSAMRAAYRRAEDSLHALEQVLAGGSGPWLFGDLVTLADLFWGIELIRMADVGVASFWEEGRLPRVERFAAATRALPAIRRAVLDWTAARF